MVSKTALIILGGGLVAGIGYAVWMSRSASATLVGKTYYIVRGNDDGIFYKEASWTHWVQLQGKTIDAPAAVMKNGSLDIIVKGSGGILYSGRVVDAEIPATFTGWTVVAGSTPSAPSIA